MAHLREAWQFLYPVEKVLDGARAQVAHHRERMEWWEKERAAADRAMHAGGVSYRTVPVTGGERTEVVIDPGIQARLNECDGGVRRHARSMEEYARWVRILESNQHQTDLALDVFDVEYFGL